MTDTPLPHLSITHLAPLIETRTVTAVEALDACLRQIGAQDRRVNAFTQVTAREARSAAAAADAEIAAGQYRGPLHGVPISVKDLIDIQGLPTTAASHVRREHRASRTAPVIARLQEAGAVLVGKCNLHEFAFGTTGEDSAFGSTRNPWDLERSAGGSSGGSAAAVAAGMCFGSVATDTGGSIRIPAAACGVVGLKPAFNELPCEGVVPLSPSLDHVGPLARSVEDAWLLFRCMAGDPQLSLPHLPLRGLALGVPTAYFFDLLEDDVRAICDEALGRLRQEGCQLQARDIDDARLAPAVYLHVVLPEASTYHDATLRDQPHDYTPAVRLRLEMGRYVLAEDYVRAQAGRRHLRDSVDRALDGVNALVLPTLPIVAPRLGTSELSVAGRTEPVRNLMLRLTQLFNLTGHPAISVPCGRVGTLPCGLQFVGRRNATRDLVAVARACEPHLQGSPPSSRRPAW